MRTTPFRRLVTALVAIWLALVIAEPPALHICAVHSTATAEHHAAHTSDGRSHHHGKQCTCLDSAYQSPTPALLPQATFLPVERRIAESVHLLPTADESFPPQPEFRLPFPNGPPALLFAAQHEAS